MSTSEENNKPLEETVQPFDEVKGKSKENGKTPEGWIEDSDRSGTAPAGYFQIPQTPVYKSGVIIDQQKIRNKKRYSELFEEKGYKGEKLEEKVEKVGLQFETTNEQRAFNAVQKLLDRTDYGSNPDSEFYLEPQESYKGKPLPRLKFHWSDFYEAFGLKRDSSGKYTSRKQVKKAREAFEKLQEPYTIAYRLPKGNGKYDVIVKERPLIQEKSSGFEAVGEEELGEEPHDKITKTVISVSPLFIEQIESYYWLKPKNLHKEIKEILGKSRYSIAIENFIIHLGIKDLSTFKIEEKKLMGEIGLGGYVERRQLSRARHYLEEALEVAKELDFLKNVEKYQNDDGEVIYKLWLSSARYSRIKSSKVEEKAEAEEG